MQINIDHRIPTIATALFGLLVVCACSKSGAPDAARDSIQAASANHQDNDDEANPTGGDPCTLLDAKEVEVALGPLAGPPYRVGSNGPDRSGDKCVYDTKDLRSLALNVTWSDGAMIMKMLGMPAGAAEKAGLKGKLPLPHGVTVSGEWDEAKALSCCEITAMRGDQVIGIDFMNTRLTTQQGIELLNAALKRLDAPLKNIVGAAGNDAVAARISVGRPKPMLACQLMTLADAQELIGPADVVPVENDRHCEYRSKSKPVLLSFSVAWTGGYRAYRSDAELAGAVMGGLMGQFAKDPADVKAVEYPGPWEQAAIISTNFTAVRCDVAMSIDIRGTSVTTAQALLTKAMNRVAWPNTP